MGRLFGTDGVRGIANFELTGDLAFDLGRAGAFVLTKENKHIPKILVGADTRISADMLESALVSGICSVGAYAVVAGVVPTPAVAYLVRKYNLDAGVVISASHNPVEYNGIKFFDGEGYKLKDELENEIEMILDNGLNNLPKPTGSNIGTKSFAENALEDYINFVTESADTTLEGVKVVIDCANGAAFKAAPAVLERLGADVTVIHNTPNGKNINDCCGSTHMGSLIKTVINIGANIGLAFDGDADRCLAVDEKGSVIDGDKILAIIGTDLKQKGKLKKDTIVGTIMSNLGFYIMGEKNGINIEKSDVGDRYVLEKMIENGYNLGGEQSGHIIFSDYNTTGDGILTGIKLLSVLKQSGKCASDLASVMEAYPQVLVNAKVGNNLKDKFLEIEEIKAHIDMLENKFAGNGRVLIRTSGTEPLVRVMIEGKDKHEIEKDAASLAKLIEDKLQ